MNISIKVDIDANIIIRRRLRKILEGTKKKAKAAGISIKYIEKKKMFSSKFRIKAAANLNDLYES